MYATQKNNSSFTFNNSESTANNMASKVLDNYINITSTGYVPPAQVINVIVAQDIDFSSVFKTVKAN
jgi:type IV secretion system protein VirB10